jgi:hypothetical protein
MTDAFCWESLVWDTCSLGYLSDGCFDIQTLPDGLGGLHVFEQGTLLRFEQKDLSRKNGVTNAAEMQKAAPWGAYKKLPEGC